MIVKPAGVPGTVMPVQATVWDFTLPRETHLKTAFALFEHELGAWYGDNTSEIRRRYYQFLLDRRVNPTNIYSAWPVPRKEDMQFCIDRGLNAFCLGYTTNWGSERREEFVRDIRDYESWLREKGWWDKAYVYGFDEIPRSKYHELRDMFGFVRKQFPDLPGMCTVVPNEELRGNVGIWVPLTAGYDHRVAGDYAGRGDEVWWYVCCTPHHPYANWFIDYPAIDARILPWMNWEYGVPGILWLLREKLEVARGRAPAELVERARRLLEVPDSVVTSLTRYTTDPEALLETRRNIALAIQELGAVE